MPSNRLLYVYGVNNSSQDESGGEGGAQTIKCTYHSNHSEHPNHPSDPGFNLKVLLVPKESLQENYGQPNNNLANKRRGR